MATFNITVRTLTDQNQQIEVTASTTCRELKQIILTALKIPIERQRLIYKGRVLKDDKKISDYGIVEDHVVHIVERDPLPVERESHTARGTAPPPAPPPAPSQGVTAQHTVPGSGARVTVHTIPVSGETMGLGAMEQLTQQIAQQVTAQFQQQHEQAVHEHRRHHHHGMPSRAQVYEGMNVVAYYHTKRVRSSLQSVIDAIQEYEALVYATWRGDPPMPSPRAAGNSPANEGGTPSQAGAHGTSSTAPPESDAAPPRSDAAPPRSDAAPPRSDAAPPKSDAAPPRSETAPPNSDTGMPSSDTDPVPAEVLRKLYADLQSVSQRLAPLVDRQQRFIASGQQVAGPFLQHYLCLNRALSHSFRALGVAYSELQNITASLHNPPPHVVQLMPIRPQIPGVNAPLQRVVHVGTTIVPTASGPAPAESPPDAPSGDSHGNRDENRANRDEGAEQEEGEGEDEEDEDEEEEEDMLQVILQGMTGGGGPPAMMQRMLRTLLGSRPSGGDSPPSRQDPPPSAQQRPTPGAGDGPHAGTGDGTTSGTGEGPTQRTGLGPSPEAAEAFNPLTLLSALGSIPDPSSPAALGSLVSGMFAGMNPNVTIADTLPSMNRPGQPSQGLMMDLLPYLARGITIGEFIQMNNASNQGPQLPNLRPNLLQFLRERVLDGREPTPSDREEVVRYFVTRIATGLIQSWYGVRVREGIDFRTSILKCVTTEVDCFVLLMLDPPAGAEGTHTLNQLEHIIAAIGGLARHCVEGDEAYFRERIIDKAIDDLYIHQMQHGAGNPLMHIMGDFASQVFSSALQNNPLPFEEIQQYVVMMGEDGLSTPQRAAPSGEGAGGTEGGSRDGQLGGGVPGSHDVEATSSQPPVTSEGMVEPSEAATVEDPPSSSPPPRLSEEQPTGSGGAASLPTREWPPGMPREWIPVLEQDVNVLRNPPPQSSHSDAYQSGNPSKKRKVTSDVLSPPEMMRRTLLSAMEQSDTIPTSKMTPEAIAAEAVEDKALTVAFTEELNQMVGERVARDPNYSAERYPAAKEFYKL